MGNGKHNIRHEPTDRSRTRSIRRRFLLQNNEGVRRTKLPKKTNIPHFRRSPHLFPRRMHESKNPPQRGSHDDSRKKLRREIRVHNTVCKPNRQKRYAVHETKILRLHRRTERHGIHSENVSEGIPRTNTKISDGTESGTIHLQKRKCNRPIRNRPFPFRNETRIGRNTFKHFRLAHIRDETISKCGKRYHSNCTINFLNNNCVHFSLDHRKRKKIA